jgi:hypothetical protein
VPRYKICVCNKMDFKVMRYIKYQNRYLEDLRSPDWNIGLHTALYVNVGPSSIASDWPVCGDESLRTKVCCPVQLTDNAPCSLKRALCERETIAPKCKTMRTKDTVSTARSLPYPVRYSSRPTHSWRRGMSVRNAQWNPRQRLVYLFG